jgi:hypothetical protein
LGSTRILTDGTQALLRQILTSTDRQGLLGQVKADLGSVEPVVIALLALVGFGAAAEAGRKVIPEAASKIGDTVVVQGLLRTLGLKPPENGKKPPEKGKKPPEKGRDQKPVGEPTIPARGDWLPPISKDPTWEVTVWLSSGWTVKGTVENQDEATTVLRINGAILTAPKSLGIQLKPASNVRPFVLVPVKDIAFITYGLEEMAPDTVTSVPGSGVGLSNFSH